MNSGTIAGLTSAPLKTKGLNLIKNAATFTRDGVGASINTSLRLINNTSTTYVDDSSGQYSPFIEWVGSGFQRNTVSIYPPGSYQAKFQAGITSSSFSNSINGGFIIRGQQTLSPTASWNNFLFFNLSGNGGYIKLSTGDWGFYGSYPNSVCWGTSPYGSVFSIGTNGRTFLGANANLGWTSAASTVIETLGDAVFSRSGAANIQQGYANAATPVSQTFSVQNASGTDVNASSISRYIDGCRGTGTGSSGNIVFRTGTPGASSATLNTLVESVTISPARTTITNEAKTERAAILETSSTSIQLDVTNYAGMVINCTATSAVTITLPTTNVPVGYNVVVIRSGTGTITFVEGTVTVGGAANVIRSYSNFKSIDSYSSASLICLKSGSSGVSAEYSLSGGLIA